MKLCKYCQAELAENGSFCPVCGKNNSEEAPEAVLAVEETAIPEVETAIPEEETAIPEEETVAPAEEAAAPEIREAKKATPAKIAAAVVAVVVLIALLIGLLAGGMGGREVPEDTQPTEEASAPVEEESVPVTEATIPADGNPDDETCKGSYTVSDEEVIAAMDTVVATAGGNQLTNAQLQIYYGMEFQSFMNNYGAYAAYFGLDYTQPLDKQVCGITEGRTWQQFFLQSAIGTWQNYCSVAAEANAAGFQMEEARRAELDSLADTLEQDALAQGFANAEEMLARSFGAGCRVEDFLAFEECYYQGLGYYQSRIAEFDTSDAAVEAYFQEHEAEFAESGVTKEDKYIDVRHILIIPEGGTTDENGVTTYSEEEWAAAEVKAQEILDQYLSGDLTEESFGNLANEHTADGNDANYDGIPDGGLYTDVYKGQMVPEFEQWCFDDTRAAGDTGLVKTTYGWHIMYFVDSRPVWKSAAKEQLTMELANQMLAEMIDKYPLEVDYSAIKLGAVDFGA